MRIEDAVRDTGSGLDLDAATDGGLELGTRPKPLYNFDDLDRVVTAESARPNGIVVNDLSQREYAYLAPGMSAPVRITTDPEYYEDNVESVELWSPGNPVFPTPDVIAERSKLNEGGSIGDLLDGVLAT